MAKELEKNYNPADIEKRTYDRWQEKKYFHAEVNRDKKPFTIVMPPPNITGQLHMGHALDNTLQDILIRFKRMQGYEALWVPGTDHASIATEFLEGSKNICSVRQRPIPCAPNAAACFASLGVSALVLTPSALYLSASSIILPK